MREHAKLQNTALIIEVKPYVIHSVIISILFEHKHIVRFEIKLPGKTPANFYQIFMISSSVKSEEVKVKRLFFLFWLCFVL